MLIRVATTEYATLTRLVGALVDKAAAPLLQLTRYPDSDVRVRACSVLQALLLECDSEEFARMQQRAATQGALLWLLVQSFEGGMKVISGATPSAAHFVEELQDVAAAEAGGRLRPAALDEEEGEGNGGSTETLADDSGSDGPPAGGKG
eukprot:6719122-Prymnesium_polylepis.1